MKKPTEAKIRARWRWDKGYPATRANIKLAVRRTGNPYGITAAGRPYLAPVIGMRVVTYAGERGKIVAINPKHRPHDPEVAIELESNGRRIYSVQTSLRGYHPSL